MPEAPRDGTWILAWYQFSLTCLFDRPMTVLWENGGWHEPFEEVVSSGLRDHDFAGWIPCPRTVQEFEAMGRAVAEERARNQELQAIWDRLPVLNEPLKEVRGA